MRIGYALLLVVFSFGAGAATVRVLHYDAPGHGASAPATPPADSAPAATGGERDSGADLEGQMMRDPNSGTYVGG
ncbi:MAG TPA: hypothetical protein VFR85_02425 [Anaeromyxobacteraceae bacterium]|nr:hypothetical protein [Anaeromyxobacteraceae bacterium]